MLPLSRWLAREDKQAPPAAATHLLRGMAATFATAWSERGFRLLMAGYFVCGFQVVFIGVHLPAYLRDHGLGGHTASLALALIGLFNIFGTMAFGELGSRWCKPGLLSFIYLARSVVIAIFLLLPLSGASVTVFAAAMGFCGCPRCR